MNGVEEDAEFEVEDQHPLITAGPASAAQSRVMPAASGSRAGLGRREGATAADVDLSRIDKVHRFPGIGR